MGLIVLRATLQCIIIIRRRLVEEKKGKRTKNFEVRYVTILALTVCLDPPTIGPQLALTVPSSRTGEVCLESTLIILYFSATPLFLGLTKHRRTRNPMKQMISASITIPIMKGSLS